MSGGVSGAQARGPEVTRVKLRANHVEVAAVRLRRSRSPVLASLTDARALGRVPPPQTDGLDRLLWCQGQGYLTWA